VAPPGAGNELHEPISRLEALHAVVVASDHDCGVPAHGLPQGLDLFLVAVAAGARVVAVDVATGALDLAREFGAEVAVDASREDVVRAVRATTGGGAHLSLDALGSHDTCAASVKCLRTRGRHVQVGLLPPDLGHPAVPMARVVALELEVVGSHGMPAHDYPALLALVAAGRLRPDLLVTRRIGLDEAGDALAAMGEPGYPAGVTVAASSNNVQNAFTPVGNGSLPLMGYLLAVAAHMGTPHEMRQALGMLTDQPARILRLRADGEQSGEQQSTAATQHYCSTVSSAASPCTCCALATAEWI